MVVSPDSFPFMVLGNKSDLSDKRSVVEGRAEQCVRDLGPDIEHLETSAKDCQNVEEAFHMLARKALSRQMEIQKKVDENSSAKRAMEREKIKQRGSQFEVGRRSKTKQPCKC